LKSIETMKLGHMRLEGFVTRPDANLNQLKLAVIGLGQAGGKMAQEFARLGVDVLAINTAKSDLDDLTMIEKENKILLGSIGGASKDIRVGRQAILDNQALVAEVLQRDKIVDADFVFVIAGLGGGTGNGGLPTVIRALNKIRAHKSYKGNPTNGVIVSVPGNWEKRGLKKNAVAGLSAIKALIDTQKVGSVLIVDNEKLANDFTEINRKLYEHTVEWEAYGNMTIASTIFELMVATSLPQVNSFDKSEFIDVFSTPGFITIGKQKLEDREINEQELERTVVRSFTQSNIFADGYTFDTEAKIGAFVVIRPVNQIITTEHKTLIESVMNSILRGANITHYGLINNNVWGTTHKNDPKEKIAILYSLAVVEDLPERVIELIKTIELEEQAIEEAKEQKKKRSLDLSGYLEMYQKDEVAATTESYSTKDLFDDDDLFSGKKNSVEKKSAKDLFADDDDL